MHQSYYSEDYIKTNREKYLDPSEGKSSWCVCDFNKVNDGQRCFVCHRISNTKKKRKFKK